MGVLVAGETEADEPFSVKLPRCLLQQRYPPPIVLHQVIVCGKESNDFVLHRERWDSNLQGLQITSTDTLYIRARSY